MLSVNGHSKAYEKHYDYQANVSKECFRPTAVLHLYYQLSHIEVYPSRSHGWILWYFTSLD